MERQYTTYETLDGSMLDRERELALAAEIEARSIALWTILLSDPASAREIARLVADRLPDAVPALALDAGEAAARLHALDVDHVIADQAAARAASSPSIAAAARAVAEARHRFVQANLPMVLFLASRYRSATLLREDLIQEGMLGLMKAVDRFDHRRGLRFSTFATWWIRNHIGRALVETGRLVRVPVHTQDSRKRVVTAREALRRELGRDPTREELAGSAGVSLDKLDDLERVAVIREVRLDAPVGDAQSQTRVDLFADPHGEESDTADAIDFRTLTGAARERLEQLSAIEREVLQRRFGLDDEDGREQTLREIADDKGLSRERIRQIEANALRKLRETLVPMVAGPRLETRAA
jgi:RNA polymerase sigma factor (sigma-70 family)